MLLGDAAICNPSQMLVGLPYHIYKSYITLMICNFECVRMGSNINISIVIVNNISGY